MGNVSLTPRLVLEPPSDPNVNSWTKVWQISMESGFNSSVMYRTGRILWFNVPSFILEADSKYFWRAKFIKSTGEESNWAAPFSFTTASVSPSDSNSDGVPDTQVVTDPTVDLDNDGESDMEQDDILVVNTPDGEQIGVKDADNADVVSITSVDPDSLPPNDKANMPDGLVVFKVKVNTPGDTTKVTVYFSKPVPEGARWYYYDPSDGLWKEYLTAEFSEDRMSVTLTITDGSPYDADGTKNGVIVIHTSGYGIPYSQPSYEDDGSGSACFISTCLK